MSAVTVKALESKSFNDPDEKRRPPKTEVDVVTVGDSTLGRFTFEPGWRWSETVKTVVHTDSCSALTQEVGQALVRAGEVSVERHGETTGHAVHGFPPGASLVEKRW